MAWPLSQDYNEAIQTPAQCFVDAELRQGEALTNTLGLPAPCSGNFADVYAVVSGQRKWAVKCFTRQIPGLRERYAEISKYLRQVQLPFMVEFSFLDQGIRVRGQWYPVLKMQWVEGVPLNQFVKAHLAKPQTLDKLCIIWPKLAARLHEANLAHGDLQHGNILLVQEREGRLGVKLVDYDGMCVPSLELLKATEVGHPAYQHPQRSREGTYNLQIDRFSHLVIYTALRSLVVGGRKLWDRYDDGDNLLFGPKDFQAPNQSPIFKELLALSDPEVPRWAGALAEAARLPVQQSPRLEDVLPSSPRPKTAIPKQAAPNPTESSPFVPSTTPTHLRKNRGSKRLVAAVLIGCLVTAGIAVGAFLLSSPPPPTSPVVVNDTKWGGTTSSSKTTFPQTAPPGPLDGKVIGSYRLTYSKGTQSNSATIRFTDDHKMVENSAEAGTWTIAGSTIIVTYNNPQWGKAELAFKDEDTLTGQHKHGNGAVWSWVLKKELAGERLARRVVGTYRLTYSKGTQSNSATIRFADDHKMFENSAEAGIWVVTGNTIIATYSNSQWGKAELVFKDEDTLTGQHKHGNGTIWSWIAVRLERDPSAPVYGAIVLEIEPEDVLVYLDGTLERFSNPKNRILNTTSGTHKLEITKNGYKPYIQQVEVVSGKTERIAVKLEPDAAALGKQAKFTIKEVMEKAHTSKLCGKVADGKASKEEKESLVEMYMALSQNKPPKGDAQSWETKTKALVDAARECVADTNKGAPKLKVAVNCKGCHAVHR